MPSPAAAAREQVTPPSDPGRLRPIDPADSPLSEVTFVVVDLETTGTVPGQSRIIEVAAARYRGGECLATFQTLVDPGCPIPPFIEALTGIADGLVVGAPSIGEVLPALVDFAAGAVLVGHNLPFDTAFIDAALLSQGAPPLAATRVDTLTLARALLAGESPDFRLGTLATFFRTVARPSHRALDDVAATGEVLAGLLERAGRLGVRSLDDLLCLPASPLGLRKLSLIEGLPRAAGVYLLRSARGRLLHVGRAADVRGRVQSLLSDTRRRTVRLLRRTAAVEYLVVGHPLEAAVWELRLRHAHRPSFDGWRRRLTGPLSLGRSAGRRPRRAVSGGVARSGGTALLDGLRAAGRVTFDVAGALVELDGGCLVAIDDRPSPVPPDRGRDDADERAVVARWLRREARAGRVRCVGPVGPAPGPAAAALEGALRLGVVDRGGRPGA